MKYWRELFVISVAIRDAGKKLWCMCRVWQGLGTPSRYLARTTSWNACKLLLLLSSFLLLILLLSFFLVLCRIWRPQSRCTGSWGPRWWWGCPSRTRPPVTPSTCPKYPPPQTKQGEEPSSAFRWPQHATCLSWQLCSCSSLVSIVCLDSCAAAAV